MYFNVEVNYIHKDSKYLIIYVFLVLFQMQLYHLRYPLQVI